MTLDRKKLGEYLACYGCDPEAWPQEARAVGRLAQGHPEFAAMIEEERWFECLLDKDMLEPMPAQLVQRVIARPFSQGAPSETGWFTLRGIFSRLPFTINPAALAVMLIFGFVIGYSAFTPDALGTEETLLQPYADDEGATL
jgi:hypothetical protein